MKRIEIVCGAGTVSGKEIMVMELADGLREKGCHVEIVTSHWGKPEFAKRFQDLGYPVHLVWFGFIAATLEPVYVWMSAVQMFRWPQLWLGYQRFLRQAQPQKVIHTNWQHSLLLMSCLRSERDLFWLHEVIPNKAQYRRVFGWLAWRLGCFVCVSDAVANSLRDIGIAAEKIRVIHNGLTDPVPAGDSLPEGGAGQRIGIIGQIARWKGHEDLLDAFCAVANEFPAAELHIFGRSQDDFETELKRKVETLGMAGRIVWHGYVADRTQIYRQIDICAVPSRSHDPLPTTAIEAGYFGLPVIASRRGGLPEIIEDGVTGLLFDIGRAGELESRLRTIFKDEALRRKMGVAARQLVLKKFGRERFVSDFERVLS